jgi:hypothetical protein
VWRVLENFSFFAEKRVTARQKLVLGCAPEWLLGWAGKLATAKIACNGQYCLQRPKLFATARLGSAKLMSLQSFLFNLTGQA